MENKIKLLEKLIKEKSYFFYLLSKNKESETELKSVSDEITQLEEILLQIKNIGILPSLEMFNFRELRKSKGLTIADVRLNTGILDSVISNIENNVVDKPSYENIKLLLDLYYTK